MKYFYNSFVHIYAFLVRLAAFFNHKKAKQRVKGVKNALEVIENTNLSDSIWFHCASLGEFEQGRPVIEKVKSLYPNQKIVITFFSPSGYEIRKDYPNADLILYLPDDKPANVQQFFLHLQPKQIYFIKYEFWYNYISYAQQKNVPVYLISGIFRRNQYFFKWYGQFFRNILKNIQLYFVQDNASAQLVKQYFNAPALVSGDTRFDRVSAIVEQNKRFSIIEDFKDSKPLILVGSSWKADEDVILNTLIRLTKEKDIKVIIAPHEIDQPRITSLLKAIPTDVITYSKATENADLKKYNFLIINNIGILSHLYKYADIAYIGGGFGKGIHNILEAATFGMPIIFGTNYLKFREARELIALQSAFSIQNTQDFEKIIERLIESDAERLALAKKSAQYVKENQGATDLIIEKTLPL